MAGIIKEALEYITGLKAPHRESINGVEYSDKSMMPIFYNPKAIEIEMNTLTSLVEYIKTNVDSLEDKMIVHVVRPTEVKLYSCLDSQRIREHLVDVNANIPRFDYEKYMDHERFCIALQAKFIDDTETDRATVLSFAGTVEDGTVAQYSDDGVSQKATVKTGIASKGEKLVPNPVALRPYRTFHEIEQPISNFIFRMRSERGVECALYEADGGSWENEAMLNIKSYLEKELDGIEGIIVIA